MKRLRAFASRHRYLFCAWLALEALSLPAAAQMIERVSFQVPDIVNVADTPMTTPGLHTYFVSSNAAFAVEVGMAVGDVDVTITPVGTYGDMAYGENAQMPGPASQCVQARFGTVEAYRSERKTAARRGLVQTQAVRVDVRFDPAASPEITIGPASESVSAPGESCIRKSA